MGDDRERVTPQAIQFGDQLRAALDGVVHTARGATSSVADRRDDSVCSTHLCDHFLRGRPSGVRFTATNELTHAVSRLQNFGHEVEKKLCPDLRIVEQTDDCAVQRRQRRRQAKCFPFRTEAWIQYSKNHRSFLDLTCHTGIVTARDFFPYHGGTTAPKPPAGPPAATTSRSSGG